MPKVKYYFNTHSLKYEKAVVSLKKKILRVAAFLSSVIVFASVTMFFAYRFLDSPKEKKLRREIEQLKIGYELLSGRLENISAVMKDLEERDDNIYRVIFEANPIAAEVRQGGYGGVNRYKSLEGYDNSDLIIEATKKIDKITKQLYIQSKSYDEIFRLAKNKNEMLACIPAIQPIPNKSLKYVASGFGFRIHPIYNTAKMQTGMDFTAPVGTAIYATGNGIVSAVNFEGKGYGNHLLINHGYGYLTLYGHLSRVLAKPGQRIRRGDLIAYVGNTGTSTGPHLHYEVIKNSKPINPVNFYYNDLSPSEYDRMVQLSSQPNQSFD